jgi:molybdopterin-guanine dinucleotide biosynthesis protein A
MQTQTGCAILAGGRGSRLGGTQKGLIELGGETLAARLVRLASPLFSEIMLVANEPSLYAFLGVPVYPDDSPGRGPLKASPPR